MKKLALSMIVGSDREAGLLTRCLSSIAPHVDAVFLTITTPNQKKLEAVARQFGAHVSHYAWDDSFERARNFALDQIPEEYGYIFWCDTDDVVENGQKLREMVSVMETQGQTALFFDYHYQISEDGTVEITHPRERIVKRGFYRWKGHLHETLLPQREANNGFYKDVVIKHYPDPTIRDEGYARNLRILEKAYQDEGETHDPRTEYYLARSYYDAEEYTKAKQLFTDYLNHSGWDEERAMAENYLGNIALVQNSLDEAIGHYLGAVRERPEWPTWYVNLAFAYALKERFDEATHYARLFVATPMPKTSMVQIPVDDERRYYQTIYMIAMGKRKVKEAREACQEMVKRFPENKEFRQKLVALNRLEELVEVTRAVETLAKELENIDQKDRITTLLNALPDSVEGNAYVEQLRQKYSPPVVWPEKSIVYWCGRSFEEWTPDSLGGGLGGSETAVVYLAREWARKGYQVTVYANPGAREGTYDGVEYKNYYRFSPQDTFDTLVIWRAPWELDRKWKARRVLLDCHDLLNALEFTPERVKNVDTIMVKSQYHRELIPDVPDGKVAIISNGIDKDLFRWGKSAKDPHKIIYASSYDRGLEQMLTYGWPVIKKLVPEATLDIYYGWQLFDAVHRHNPERMMWKKRMQELMDQPGIRECGRVGQEQLIKAKSKASVHWYGSIFEEIDCISVRESAMAGCIPVTTTIGALKGKPYSVQVDGDPYSKQTHEQLAEAVATQLRDKTPHPTFKQKAREETWDRIATAWQAYL